MYAKFFEHCNTVSFVYNHNIYNVSEQTSMGSFYNDTHHNNNDPILMECWYSNLSLYYFLNNFNTCMLGSSAYLVQRDIAFNPRLLANQRATAPDLDTPALQ